MSTRVWSLTLRSSIEVGFCHESLSSYDFKWSYLASGTQMETSCDRNSPKLSSVDQKVFMIVIGLFSDSRFFIFYNRYMDIVSPKLRFFDLVRDGCLGNVLRGSEPNSSRVRVKFQNFHVIRYEKSLIISM